MTGDKLHVQEDSAGEFRWHRKAGNGEIIGQGESHSREADAWRAGYRANPDLAPRSGMDNATDRAVAVMLETEEREQGHTCDVHEDRLAEYARALAEAGLLAPAPLTEEWAAIDDDGDVRMRYGADSHSPHREFGTSWTYSRWVTDWKRWGE